MIEYVDDALAKAVSNAKPGLISSIAITFDPPTKDTVQVRAQRQCVDIYLYDIQDAAQRRSSGSIQVRAAASVENPVSGRMEYKPVGRHAPPRHLTLSYMVTAWLAQPRDSHQILGLIFSHLAKSPTLTIPNYPWPGDDGTLNSQEVYAEMDVGRPPVQDRILTELWTTFNNTLVPFLNVTVTLPVPAFTTEQIDHLVEHPVVSPVSVLSDHGRSLERGGTP